MNPHPTEQNSPSLCIALLAHVDAGKTTLSEQILTLAGIRRTPGRVDHRDTLLDADAIERERGITIFADQCDFCYAGRNFTLIDTPGHVDFSAEAERALAVPDVAVLLADASERLRPHAANLAAIAARRRIPLVLFLNKCDLAAADPERALRAAAQRLGREILPMPCEPERLAELDEVFMERYLEEDYTEADLDEALCRIFAGGEVVPAFTGSALKGEGVAALLTALAKWAPKRTFSDDAPLSGTVYRIRRDEKGRRMAFVRIWSGRLRTRSEIRIGDRVEKVNELRRIYGTKSENLDCARAGDAVALIGGTGLRCGDRLRQNGDGVIFVEPSEDVSSRAVLVSAVHCSDKLPSAALAETLKQLEDEDPALEILHEPRTNELLVHVMGPVQLEVLAQLMLTRYGLHITFSETRVLYAETVAAPVQGYGHYEPLRHYAEAHIRVEPLPRGSGVQFASACHVDRLALPYQKTVENALREKKHLGVLTGSPLTDVRLVLTDGRGHDKHTEGGDFREASCRAVRQALMQAQSVLLEPFYRFEITVPQSFSGRVMSDIRAMFGEFEPPETEGDEVTIRGRGPVARFSGYTLALRSFTHGEGAALFLPDGYDRYHNPDEVIAAIGYRAEGDLDNPSDSVFCSHGAGYNVPWSEAEGMMHCLKR